MAENPDKTCCRRRPPSRGRPHARTPPWGEPPRPKPAMSASPSSPRHVASSPLPCETAMAKNWTQLANLVLTLKNFESELHIYCLVGIFCQASSLFFTVHIIDVSNLIFFAQLTGFTGSKSLSP